MIFLLSSRRWPVAPVTETRSEPARSTRFSLPTFTFLFFFCICSTMMMKTAWERELTSFIFVAAVARLRMPSFISA